MMVLISQLIFAQFLISAPLRVSIDPGHGGDDRGAVHGGVKESSLNLKISKLLYKRLKKDRRFKVQILRTNESQLALEDRIHRAEAFKADLFISIHANANTNPKAKGAEFYIQNQLPMEEEQGFLAHNEFKHQESAQKQSMGDVESIIDDLKKSQRILESYQVGGYLRKNWSPRKNKMLRQGPFYVLSQNQAPAVLIEVGYLTHPSERKKLTQKSYQNKLVKNIHVALTDYAKNMDKLPPSILKAQNAKKR